MEKDARKKVLNQELEKREYPFAATALPKGPDPAWQNAMGTTKNSHAPIFNQDGQGSPYYPPDCNGAAGPYHFFQTVNSTFTIYNKQGTVVAGPTNLNLLFNGVTGSNYNDGDPIVLYDDQADRWLVSEFSISGTNNYEMIAISSTNDPTGTWYAYSFDVADMPDYPKLSVWRDGYYMGTNTNPGTDTYVFERDKMLLGQTAQMVAFDNPWRPTTIDGFMCISPIDNDGTYAPSGAPGLFITINDDAIGGGSDQLWIYELSVNWITPASSTFTRPYTLNTASFDSNFGTNWDNIPQSGTTQKLDAIPMVMMNVPQYRNFGSYQTIVCCHTVDLDATNHAGIRWYELRKTTGAWSIRQQGTYGPDANSRWMGSVMLNGNNEIAIGYSISSSSLFPGIRYTGQSSSAYAAGAGTLDIAEDIIQTGAYYQTTYNRWGDYSQMSVDPVDDKTFWFTTEYIGSGSARKSRIANFQFGTVLLHANFSASILNTDINQTVTFTDASTGGATAWSWSFSPSTVTYVNSTTSTSRNPQVQFTATGAYTVTLAVTGAPGSDSEVKTEYIHIGTPGIWTGITSSDWNTGSNWQNYGVPSSSTNITIPASAPNWPNYPGNLTIGSTSGNVNLATTSQLNVAGNLVISPGYSLNVTGNGIVRVGGDWTKYGVFNTGTGTVEFTGATAGNITPNLSPVTYIPNYARSTFNLGMTALTTPTAGPTGDDAIATVPIGFTFTYLGTAYTTTQISTNGWISMNASGTALSYDNAVLFNSTVPNVTIAPWFDDLQDDNQSVVGYKTEGSAPNRVFTAEWYNVRSFASNNNYVRINFQVKLYETTNIIEFHYGTVGTGTHNAGEGASIGIEDATGGATHFKEATTGSTITGVTTLTSLSNWPTANYRFTPPSNLQEFYNLTVSKANASVVNSGSVTVNGNLSIAP
jgi:PKD repeat protein